MANRLSCRKSEDIANGSDHRTQMLSLPFCVSGLLGLPDRLCLNKKPKV